MWVSCFSAALLVWGLAPSWVQTEEFAHSGVMRGYEGVMLNNVTAKQWFGAAVVGCAMLAMIVCLWRNEKVEWPLRKGGATNFSMRKLKSSIGDDELNGSAKIGAHFGGVIDDVEGLQHGECSPRAECNGADNLYRRSQNNDAVGSQKYLLPLRNVNVEDKPLTIVLDLDDTLVMARKTRELPGRIMEGIEKGLLTARCMKSAQGKQDDDVTIVFRPGVRKFLEKLATFAELVVFTAGSAAYANPLIDCLDEDGSLFSGRLFRCSTVKTRYMEYVKDLSLLGRQMSRTVLLDDKPCSGLLQPYNIVPCAPFVGDPRDHQLLVAYLPLLEHLSCVGDVRPVLKETFQMHDYMLQWGVQEAFLKRCLDNPENTNHLKLQ